MNQRKIDITQVEAYNTRLKNIKTELEIKINSYINGLEKLSNENAIEGAVKFQLEDFFNDIKLFLNQDLSPKLEEFTNNVTKDIESIKATDTNTASKISSILKMDSPTSRISTEQGRNMIWGTPAPSTPINPSESNREVHVSGQDRNYNPESSSLNDINEMQMREKEMKIREEEMQMREKELQRYKEMQRQEEKIRDIVNDLGF